MSEIAELAVDLGSRSYPIHIGSGLLGGNVLADTLARYPQVFVVTNEVVAPLYLARAVAPLENGEIHQEIIPDGERYKSHETLWRILDRMVAARIERGAAVVALGGGVIGDIAGFAAAIYQRGIDYVQVPTTLLAQVDSSVGGKTAINHPEAKNMIGAFHQPVAVVADTDTLNTLPDREYRGGLAEIVKYGIIRDHEFFVWIEAHLKALQARDPEALARAIRRSCENKAAVVAADEREAGERALLNLGHTFGHAFETLLGYGTWLHGEAVAAGMAIAARLSAARGTLDPTAAERIEALLTALKLPVRLPESLAVDDVWKAMLSDKKTAHGKPKLILPEDIGRSVSVADYDAQQVLDVLRAAQTACTPAELVA